METKTNFKAKLNQQQYDAVVTTEGPVAIIAGAGTGKTTVLINRVAYLIEKGVSPASILLITFTNKAANEMKERVNSLIGPEGQEVNACTYHSFCVQILRRYARAVGIDNNFTIMAAGDGSDIISMLKTERNYHKIKGFPTSTATISLISGAFNKNVNLKFYINGGKYDAYKAEVVELAKAYHEYKKENSMLDYDDLLYYTCLLFKKRPDLAKDVSDTYKYIMVDEYQDTNNVQDEIIQLLRTDNRNLAVVGDDYQSIYKFRGSNVQNIINFPKKYPGCKMIYLTQNYRSNQEIIDLANNVMDRHATEGFKKQLVATHNSQFKPCYVSVKDTNKEAFFILDRIKELQAAGVPLNEICILFRNSFQSAWLENQLINKAIPYVKYGGMKFFEMKCILDALAYLRCSTNYKDEIAWYRILQLHNGIGKTFARRIAQMCCEQGPNALINNPYQKRMFYPELQLLHTFMTSLREAEMSSIIKDIKDFYIDVNDRNITNMKTTEEHREELFEMNETAKEALDQLHEVAKDRKDVLTFLDDLSLDNADDGVADVNGNNLILSTIHSAKGLEFKAVFILDCIEGVLPGENLDKEDVSEELRCFYVAMTRAKEYLYIFRPEVIQKYGQYMNGKICRFMCGMRPYLNTNIIKEEFVFHKPMKRAG